MSYINIKYLGITVHVYKCCLPRSLSPSVPHRCCPPLAPKLQVQVFPTGSVCPHHQEGAGRDPSASSPCAPGFWGRDSPFASCTCRKQDGSCTLPSHSPARCLSAGTSSAFQLVNWALIYVHQLLGSPTGDWEGMLSLTLTLTLGTQDLNILVYAHKK